MAVNLDFKVTGLGALDVSCARLTHDLFAIAKFLFFINDSDDDDELYDMTFLSFTTLTDLLSNGARRQRSICRYVRNALAVRALSTFCYTLSRIFAVSV